MNSKYKFLCVILACFLILSLFSSCAGIGDGALFDNITTGEPKEITLEAEGVAVAKLVAYNSDRSVMGKLSLTDADAEELYEHLTDSSNYTNDTETDMMSKASIQIDFEGINGKINLDSQNAVEVFDSFYITSDDIVSMNVSEIEAGREGRFDGVYETLLLKILNNVTEEEKAAGVKLNCLSVVMHPGVSRTFFLDDFKDIGGIYLKHLTTSEGYQALIYFESCTPAELEEKLDTVKTMSVVASANKIHVYAYYGTALAE